MPPVELFKGLNAEDVIKEIEKYKKFDKRWNIVKLLGYLFIGVSFIFSGGIGFQKSMDWKSSMDDFKIEAFSRIDNLEAFTKCPRVYTTHKERQEFLDKTKVKDGGDN